MSTRHLLGFLVVGLGTLGLGGAAHAIPCGIETPCPSDVLTIMNAAGAILTDINGNPAQITILETSNESLQNVPVTIDVPASVALPSTEIFLTDGPPIPGSFTPLSDTVTLSTNATFDANGNLVKLDWLFSLASGENTLISCPTTNSFSDQCIEETHPLQDLTTALVVSELLQVQLTSTEVPEPSTALFLSAGIVGIAVRRSRARLDR